MAKFLTTSGASSEIENIIKNAKKRVVLISPYVKIPDLLRPRLKHIDQKGFKIIIICREKDLKPEVKDDLKQLENLELRFDENLHAKCFYNEESMVISSLNLTEYAQKNNIEMGILLSTNDHDIFDEARKEVEYIISNSKAYSTDVIKEPKSKIYSTNNKDSNAPKRNINPGYCISCGISISSPIKHPFCDEHFKAWEWAHSENRPFRGHYCYNCGEPAVATYSKPLCESCLQKTRKR